MIKTIVLGIILISFSAQADVVCSDMSGKTLVTVKEKELVVTIPHKEKKSLNIQLSARDDRFIVADERDVQQIPATGSVIKDSTILLFASQKEERQDQAILQYGGSSYFVLCK